MIHIHTSRQQWLFNFLCLFFVASFAKAQSTDSLTFLFVGDVMQHGPQINGSYNELTKTHQYEDAYQFIQPWIEAPDFAIANLEVTHAGKPYSGYPQFSAPDELSKLLKNVGFDVLVTANNHSCDGGDKGVIRTLDVLDKLGMPHTGTFRSAEERSKNYPLILDKKGFKIALLNYTYGTNGLKVNAPLIINYIDSSQMALDVKKAKDLKADYIICAIHWGTEYQSLPSAYQKNYEKYLYSLGVNLIVGSHPHVIQPIEVKKIKGEERLTAFSLGNFVSNQKDRYKNGGMLLQFTLKKEQKTSLHDHRYGLFYIHIKQEKNQKNYYILPEFEYNAYRKGFLGRDDLLKMDTFFRDSRALLLKHSTQSQEITVGDISTFKTKYQQLLGGYYAVLLEKRSDTLTPSYWKNKTLIDGRLTLDSSGALVYLAGFFKTKEEADFHKVFLKDADIELPFKTVFVLPQELKIIEE